jgi:hypothetical protein
LGRTSNRSSYFRSWRRAVESGEQRSTIGNERELRLVRSTAGSPPTCATRSRDGGTIQKVVVVDVSGDHYVDLDLEGMKALKND